jgi:hypothetical protein
MVESSSWKEQFEPTKHAKQRKQGQADVPERAFARKVNPGYYEIGPISVV